MDSECVHILLMFNTADDRTYTVDVLYTYVYIIFILLNNNFVFNSNDCRVVRLCVLTGAEVLSTLNLL